MRVQQFQRGLLPVDPGVLLDLEQHAQVVARDLCHVMDNLRNSLHAVSTHHLHTCATSYTCLVCGDVLQSLWPVMPCQGS